MSFRRLLIVLGLGLVTALQLGGSCATSSGGSDRNDDGHWSENDRPRRIPRGADLVREGRGKLKWDADLDGTIFVYDVSKDFIAYTGPVRRGQEVVVHPDEDRVYVQQRVVFRDNLRKDAVYQLYFARERGGDNNRPGSINDLPSGAERLARGRGDIAINEAPRDGNVYVYDEDDRRVIYSTDIGRGNSFQIFPDKGYVNLNSKRHASVRFPRGHQFGLYFSRR